MIDIYESLRAVYTLTNAIVEQFLADERNLLGMTDQQVMERLGHNGQVTRSDSWECESAAILFGTPSSIAGCRYNKLLHVFSYTQFVLNERLLTSIRSAPEMICLRLGSSGKIPWTWPM